MRHGIIIQVKGLGIPVQAPSNRHESGFELRWSSDPDVPSDAPGHVLIGSKEVTRFLQLGVDRQFTDAKLLTLTTISVADDTQAVSRADLIAAGVHADNWETVRVGLVISGDAAKGPVMDNVEWLGTRDEYAEGKHMAEAYQHALRRGIRSPAIFANAESVQVLRAADRLRTFQQQMKPALRSAQAMSEALEAAVIGIDTDTLTGERAIHYLRQLQDAFVNNRREQLFLTQPDAPIEPEPVPEPPKPRGSFAPKLH